VVLQFRVDDVDQQYLRLQDFVKTWVKPPTTQPWGTRSIYFRDPDGNLVDFYAPIKVRGTLKRRSEVRLDAIFRTLFASVLADIVCAVFMISPFCCLHGFHFFGSFSFGRFFERAELSDVICFG
jgi:hypothetical protein